MNKLHSKNQLEIREEGKLYKEADMNKMKTMIMMNNNTMRMEIIRMKLTTNIQMKLFLIMEKNPKRKRWALALNL